MREIRRPDTVVETVMPSIAGTSNRPDSVGVAPVVVCRNSGTNTVIENSAAVPRKSAELDTATAGFFRALGGAVGAAVLGAVFAAQAGATAHEGAGLAGVHRTDVIDGVQAVFAVAAPLAALALLAVLALVEVPLRAAAAPRTGKEATA